jgi:eukaryotic-like serine/threonine-protein kinase
MSTERAAREAESPQALGDLRVVSVLGGGRNSIVYRAEDPDRKTAMAVKMAREADDSPAIEREASLLARLNRAAHPGVVERAACGTWNGRAWFAMEYLAEGDLRDVAPGAGLQYRLALALRVADALALIHEHGIVHGDVSPANVRLRNPGEPVIVDFGVAADFGLPVSGIFQRTGTPGYVAPERLAGTPHDFRADVYSLGCILYELFVGRPVFVSDRKEGLGRQHLEAEPVPPSRLARELPAGIDALILGMLEKDPRRRIAHMSDVCAELARISGVSGRTWYDRLAPLLPARFAGRDREMRRLRQRVTDLSGGRGGTTLLLGEPGIGKSRLIQELTSSLSHETVTVLVSNATNARQALGGFRPIFAQLSRELRSEAISPDADLFALAAYDPEISALFAPLHPERQAPEQLSKDAVYVAVLRCVRRLCERRGLLLVIDDLECVDELTLGFLSSPAARELGTLPCWLLLASSDAVLPNLEGDTIRLDPLSTPAVESMLSDLFAASSVSAELLESARHNTGNNPLLVLEFARHLREKRLAIRALGSRLTIAPGSDAEQPADAPSFHPFAGAVASLAPRLRLLAAAAAIVGGTFDPRLLDGAIRAAAAEDEADTGRGLSELSAHGILAALPGGFYRFTHEAYRSACEPYLDQARRAAVHEHLARHLAMLPVARRPHREIGLHWAAAGQPARALGPLRIAARRAAAVLALDDSVWLLRTAYRLCLPTPPTERRYRTLSARIGVELLESLARVARHDEVFTVGEELLERIPAGRRLLRARVHWLLAQAHRITGDYRSAEEQLDLADRTLGPAGALKSLVERRSFVDLGLLRVFVHYNCRDLRRLELALKTLGPIVEAFGHPAQRATYAMWRANAIAVEKRYRHSPAAIRFERRALSLFRRTRGHDKDATMSQFDLAFMLLLGRGKHCREALALLEDAARRCEHLGDAVLNARISTYRAVAHRRLRQPLQCRSLAERALIDAGACKLRGYMGAAKACLAWVALREDAPAEARRLAEDARSLWSGPAKRGEEYPFQWLAFLPLLALAASDEALEEARALVLELIQPTQQRLAAPVDDALTHLAVEWKALGDAARGQKLQAVIRLASEHRYL